MRGDVAVVILVIALAPRPAAAEPLVTSPQGQAGASLYTDDMSTTIVTPRAGAGARVTGALDLEAHWSADVITSASVDVITAATTRMEELRNEVGVTLARENLLRDVDVDGGYSWSTENDTDSHTFTGGAKLSILDQNLDLAIRAGTSYNRIGVLDQPADEWDDLWVHDADLSATVVIDPRTTAELVASGFLALGQQANPYRRVPVTTGIDLRRAAWLPELVPDERLRGAATLRLRRALGDRWVASVEGRLYGDDWGVRSLTESLELVLEIGGGLSVRARERGTLQGAAHFYRERYEDDSTYRTRDRRLSPHESLSGGLALQWAVGRFATASPIDLIVAGDALAWNYHDFMGPSLSSTGQASMEQLGWVTAFIGQVGVTAEW
jgi:hypothetical protein